MRNAMMWETRSASRFDSYYYLSLVKCFRLSVWALDNDWLTLASYRSQAVCCGSVIAKTVLSSPRYIIPTIFSEAKEEIGSAGKIMLATDIMKTAVIVPLPMKRTMRLQLTLVQGWRGDWLSREATWKSMVFQLLSISQETVGKSTKPIPVDIVVTCSW